MVPANETAEPFVRPGGSGPKSCHLAHGDHKTMNTELIDYRNPEQIRQIGFSALAEALGPVGMAYFIRQFDRGEGDYTAERQSLLAGMTMEAVERELKP